MSEINIKKKNEGKFTASAKAAGESVQEHARKVLADPNATPLLKKRANFARNAASWKHEDGGKVSIEERVKRFRHVTKAAAGAQLSLARQNLADVEVGEYRLPTLEDVTSASTPSAAHETTWDDNYADVRGASSTTESSPATAQEESPFDKVDFSRMNSATLGLNYVLTDLFKHMCTSGPGTWLLEGLGYDVNKHDGWWDTPYSNQTVTANFIKNDPTHWKLVYASDGDKADDFKGMKKGDISISLASKDDGSATSHAAMYTGSAWHSDAIQSGAWVYKNKKGRNGDQSYLVYRYVPDGTAMAKEGGVLKAATGLSLARQNLADVEVGEPIFQTFGDTTSDTSSATQTGETWDGLHALVNPTVAATPQNTPQAAPATTSSTAVPGTSGSSRGYRNNNPLNIVKSNNAWEGKIANSTDSKFEQFESIAYGYRAAMKNMQAQIRRGQDTISKLIHTWDPAQRIDGSSPYIKFVAEQAGMDPNEKINPNDPNVMTKLTAAMALFENGSAANMDDVLQAWKLLQGQA